MWRARRRSGACALLACCLLVGCCLLFGVAATASGAATHAAGADTSHPNVLPNCLGKPTVEPSEVILACADAGLGVRRITWLGWGSALAAGVGIAFANDCTPDCAAGHFHSYQAVLILKGAQRCGSELAYKTATVAIVGTPPTAFARPADATYPLRCAS